MRHYSLRIMLIVSVLLLLSITGSASAEVSPELASLNLAPNQWIGHDFLFLDLPADKQAKGYADFTGDWAMLNFVGDCAVRIPYAEHVGKRVTVTDVVTYDTGDKQYEYIVYLKENGTQEKLVGRTMRGQFEGLVLEEDLIKARQQFMGKIVYVKQRILQGVYDPQTKITPKAVVTRIGDPVKVVDVYAGIQANEPIWLIVLVNGQKAILPIAYSCTNMSVNAWTESPPWQEALFMEDPHANLGWSQAIWDQIEAGVVQEGMTKAQVRLSWGSPVSIDKNTDGLSKEVWKYGTKVLGFIGDNLISIENVNN